MEFTTPRVHLVARPAINWSGVSSYLGDVGGRAWSARRAGEDNPAAQDLIEFMGRACYRSWEPGLNANVSRVREDQEAYLANIIDVGHGSVLEHASFSFIFHDVSRVFTHELCRHRAGVAISQESLRFVRLTDLKVWLPEALDERPEDKDHTEHAEFIDGFVAIVEQLEDWQREAADYFGLDDEGVPFSYKKHVTSALRRLAPIGLATSIGWTANVRTLRWVIEMRTAPSAEEEIRLVFDRVAGIMRREAPALFGDFERDEDGTWIPGSRKV